MPICHIEAPPGISPGAEKTMMEKFTAAIEEGYQHIGDTFIFLHEDKPDYVMMNGRLASEDPKYESFRSQSSREVRLVSTHRPRSGWGQSATRLIASLGVGIWSRQRTRANPRCCLRVHALERALIIAQTAERPGVDPFANRGRAVSVVVD